MNRLLMIAQWCCGESRRRSIFEPLVADWQRELATARGSWTYARVLWSGAIAYASTLAGCAMSGGAWLPTARAAQSAFLVSLLALGTGLCCLWIMGLPSRRSVDIWSIQTQIFLISTASLIVPTVLMPALFMMRRDSRSTTRHAVAAIALSALVTAGVVVLTSPPAINSYFMRSSWFERQYQRDLANDRAGRYQYPGTVIRQLGNDTLEQRRERAERFVAWLSEQDAKSPPLTWEQQLRRFQPVALGVLFGVMGWTLGGLGKPSFARAAWWWALMYVAKLTVSGMVGSLFGYSNGIPRSTTLPLFALATAALLMASRRHPARTS